MNSSQDSHLSSEQQAFDSDLESLLNLSAERKKHSELERDLASGKVLGSKRQDFYGADSSSEEGPDDEDDYQEAIRLQKLRAKKLNAVIKERQTETVQSKPQERKSNKSLDRKTKLQQLLESEKSQGEEEGVKELRIKDPQQFGMIHSELTYCVMELDEAVMPFLKKESREGKDVEYCKVKKQLIECYMSNLLFYIMAEIRKVNLKDHPVVLRLAYLKSMMKQLEPLDQDLYKGVEDELKLQLSQEEELKPEQVDQNPSSEYFSAKENWEENDESEISKDQERLDLTQFKEALKESKSLQEMKINERRPEIRPGKKLLSVRKAALKIKDDQQESSDEEIIKPMKKKKKRVEEKDVSHQDTKFYKEVATNLKTEKQQRRQKKQERKEEFQKELLQKHNINQRNINYRILKNKGLTRKRKREDRNPRVKLRHKFQRAEKKRKHLVKEASALKGVYEGEKTGLRSTVVRSRVLD